VPVRVNTALVQHSSYFWWRYLGSYKCLSVNMAILRKSNCVCLIISYASVFQTGRAIYGNLTLRLVHATIVAVEMQ